jgi:S-formylglutathione hydrolase FrmB
MRSTEEHQITSAALGRSVAYSLIVPDGAPPAGGWPLVLLLHGRGRDHRTVAGDPRWAAVLAAQPFATACPHGEDGWYCDSPVDPAARYGSALREVLDHLRATAPVSADPARTGVAGWSMGGYGAVRCAETVPVGAVASIIGLLDFPTEASEYPVPAHFGPPETWSAQNPLTHAGRLRGTHILLLAGRDAWDYPMNRAFHARLDALDIAHDYEELPGGHVWDTVANALPRVLGFMAGALL